MARYGSVLRFLMIRWRGLLTRAGYEPVIAEDMEAATQEETKLSPGAVINSQTR